MRGRMYTTDDRLVDEDLEELADELSIKLYATIGPKVYLLSRQDINELVAQYIDDLSDEDREAVPWLMWDLFQQGMELEFG